MSEQYNGTNWETRETERYFEHYFDERNEYVDVKQVADETLGAYSLGKMLKEDFVDNMAEIPESGWAAEMANAALREVNFTEIASDILDAVREWDSYKEYVAELADDDDDDELVLS